MDDNTLSILEYDAVLQWLADETHSLPAYNAALALLPDLNDQEILQSWQRVEHGLEVLALGSLPDFSGHLFLGDILERLKVEGSMLNAEELALVGQEARAINSARNLFEGLRESTPSLWELAQNLTPQNELADAIEHTIGPDGEILDSASPELARLRMEQASTKHGLTSKLSNLMRSESFRHIVQDELITTRSERFVVPVRASDAGKGRGLVHDWSQTGATAFLEPLEVVEDNNRLGLLKRKEKAEIERILRRLSQLAFEAAPSFIISGEILTQLDLIMAQARLARAWSASKPQYAPGKGFGLKNARHPLLMRRLQQSGGRMTPLELKIDPGKPVIVISGLNTGGKTVAMKTLGLNLCLAKSGLLPAVGEGSFMEFTDLVAVMGDEQDLGSDLSTFSGHIRSLNRVLNSAGPGLLILLDEIGSGTDPAEGAALGLAVLEQLYGSGALVMAATHYQLIKTWAALTDGVVSVAVNSSDSGQPLYGLTYGSPGFSGGLKMAKRLGLPEELVKRAEDSLDEGQRRAMELLAKLDEERSALIRAQEDLEEQKMEMARRNLELKQQLERQADIFEKKSREQNMAISQALTTAAREFDLLKKEMREAISSGDQKRIMAIGEKKSQAEKKLRSARPQAPVVEQALESVHPGDRVMLRKLGRHGLIKSINAEKGEAWVDTGGFNVKVNISDLLAPREEKAEKRQSVHVTVSPAQSHGLSINLLGQTVEQAIDAIEKELDQATVAGRSSFYIIHGFGTGKLRSGIRGFLKNHPRVRSFERAPQNAGGDGVTVVYLE